MSANATAAVIAVGNFVKGLTGDEVAKTESTYKSIIENQTSCRTRKTKLEQSLAAANEKVAAIVEGRETGDVEKLTIEIIETEKKLEAIGREMNARENAAAKGKEAVERAVRRAAEANVERLVAAAATAATRAEEKLEPKLREIRAIVDEAYQAHDAAVGAAHNAKIEIPWNLALDVQSIANELNAEVRAKNGPTWAFSIELLVPRS